MRETYFFNSSFVFMYPIVIQCTVYNGVLLHDNKPPHHLVITTFVLDYYKRTIYAMLQWGSSYPIADTFNFCLNIPPWCKQRLVDSEALTKRHKSSGRERFVHNVNNLLLGWNQRYLKWLGGNSFSTKWKSNSTCFVREWSTGLTDK